MTGNELQTELTKAYSLSELVGGGLVITDQFFFYLYVDYIYIYYLDICTVLIDLRGLKTSVSPMYAP